nr:hypothetical protein [Tanacetum cinerariifolium]
MINGKIANLTEHEIQDYRDKEEEINKAEEEAKLNAISKTEVIKVTRKESKKLGIHPKEAITTKDVYRGTDGRNFDVHKPFLFGAFSISKLDELRDIIPKKKNTVSALPAPEQAPSQTSRRKRKHMELEPETRIPGLECNRTLPENVMFVNNMVIEEPNDSLFRVAFSPTISAGGGGGRGENTTHGVVLAPLTRVFTDGSSRQPPFDHYGMVLTNTPFNGGNFLGWSRNVKMALGAKLKLGFIDEAFLYAQSAYELWKEIAERYEQSVLDKVLERDGHLKLIQFLMKLSDEYESVRSQILAMDPLPNVNKAYYIVQQIEKQKQVTSYTFEPFAFFANTNNTRHNNNTRKEVKQSRVDNRSDQKRTCTHCIQEGHVFYQCFERIGYPDWYKENEIRLGQNGNVDQRLVAAVCSETMEMFKGKGIVEDLTTKEIMAVGNGSRCLYICKPMVDPAGFAASIDEFQKSHQFSSPFTFLNKTAYNNVVNTESNLDIQLFHARLGHTSVSKLVHIPRCKKEVINRSCTALFKTKGILHQKSMPYTPQQNGVVERKHMHLLKISRSLRVHANLPIKFWGELTKPHKDKFDNRGLKCIWIGYPSNQKGDSKAIEEPFVSPTPLPQTNPNIEFDHPNNPFSLADYHQHPPSEPHFLNIPLAPARKSSRTSTRPAWMKDFVTKGTTGSAAFCSRQPQYPLFGKADFAGLLASHIAFLANVFAHSEPHSYKQAMTDKGWVEAMNKELQALEKNNTWEQTTLPLVYKPITLKWVFKIKYYPDGSLDKFKARLVVREGYTKAAPNQVCQLKRSLYGLKQSPRQWNHELTKFLISLGYVQSKHDYSLFLKITNGKFTAVLVYVDDMLITSDCQQEILFLKQALHQKFTIKDLGLAKYFLGIELCRTLVGTYLNQRKYILDLLSDACLTAAKPKEFPLPIQLKLSLNKVQHLSQFVSFPKDVHMQDALHLLKYLKGTVSKVSRSSTEAEYRSMAATTCELLWLSYLLKDLNIPTQCPVTLFCANKSAQQIAANPCYHDKTKYLDINCQFTRDKVQDGFLQTAYIPTQSQIADVMTKALGAIQHSYLSFKLGLAEPPT